MHRVFLPVAFLAATAPSLAAQHVDGTVLGFDGKPAEGATVRLYDPSGTGIIQFSTDARGAFAFDCAGPIGSVEAQLEGVVAEHTVHNGSQRGLLLAIARVPYYTLRGHLVDPGGLALDGVELWLVDEKERPIAAFASAAKGSFTIRASSAAAAILVDPRGWRCSHAGPFDGDAGVALDLRLLRDDFFRVNGRVLRSDGTPLSDGRVLGSFSMSETGSCKTDSNGAYALWSRKAFESIRVERSGEDQAVVLGSWSQETELDIDLQKWGFVLVSGRVVDDHRRSVPRAAIFATLTEGEPAKSSRRVATTGADGSFVARVPRCLPFLLATRGGGRTAATTWNPDMVADIVLPR